jgi:predicted enzyme related to lactoylglutathione lyase
MTTGARTIIFPATDLTASKAVFTRLLGAEPIADAPYYVGYEVAGQHIGLDPHGHREGPTVYWTVDDIEAALAELKEAGATELSGAKDVGGRLIATVKDPHGNVVGLSQDRA